jgi:hypothetical protein
MRDSLYEWLNSGCAFPKYNNPSNIAAGATVGRSDWIPLSSTFGGLLRTGRVRLAVEQFEELARGRA